MNLQSDGSNQGAPAAAGACRQPFDGIMDSDLLAFIRKSIASVLALEVLLFLRSRGAGGWTPEALAAELRHSATSCDAVMAAFAGAGLLARQDAEYAYAPDSPALDRLVARLAGAYAERPVAVINTIVGKDA